MEEPGDKKRHVFDDARAVKKFVRIFFASCAVIFLADAVFFFDHKHLSFEEGEFAPEGWFGFYGIFGFVACVLLVLAAKQMRKLVMREEDYYDR